MRNSPTLDILRGILARHRTLRRDWHPRAEGNSDFQVGYEQAKHDTRNIITQAIRDEVRALKERDGTE